MYDDELTYCSFEETVPKIYINDNMMRKLEDIADLYNMSPYYFVKIIAVRFVSQRENISITELMKDERACQVVNNIDDLEEEDNKNMILGNGLTDVFWDKIQEYASKYGMDKIEYFHYILLRFTDDHESINLAHDLKPAFGLTHMMVEENKVIEAEEKDDLHIEDLF